MTELDRLIEDCRGLRRQWREVRHTRLNRKKELMDRGISAREIRKDRELRSLRKRQKYFSRRIVHLERKINRKKQSHERQQ